jgi:hypothetical protein
MDNHDYFNYLCPYKDINEYIDEVSLRIKMFSYNEEFYLIKNASNDIKGICSIIIPTIKNSTVATFGFVSLPVDHLSESYEFIKNTISDIATKELTKLRINVTFDEENYIGLIERFKSLGMNNEYTFNKEYGNTNVTILEEILL